MFGMDYVEYMRQPRFWIESVSNYLIAVNEVQQNDGAD